jgi:DNA polymerase I-like protein with 3'-5' exonuclease and polymerase domains
MTEIAFVFSSTSERDPHKTMSKYVEQEFDAFFLCSTPKEKVLKKDIDLDMKNLEDYKIVCPVGAEPLKYVVGLTGITKYNGMFIEKKYVPFINPSMVIFKPQYADDLVKAAKTITKILDGTLDTEIVEKDYRFVQTNEELLPLLSQFDSVKDLVVDIETSSLSPRTGEILGVALSTKSNEGYYISKDLILLHKAYFHNLFKNKKCIFHNAKFDMGFLTYEMGFKFPDFEDTMLLHYCLEEAVGTHGLKPLALRFTDLGDYEKELDDYKKAFCRKNKILLKDFNYGMFPTEILAPYACKDGDGTNQLYSKFKPIVDNSKYFNSLYSNILKPATEALMFLEDNGGPIDRDKLKDLEEDYTIDIEECLVEIEMNPDVATFERINNKTFNPNSTQQLQKLFFDIIKLKPIKRTATGAWSVDKEVLAELDHPLAQAILDLREKTKMKSTYISSIRVGIDKDGRLRSGFNIHGTTSGRLSSSGVLNYQNIPRDNKDIKKLFKARPGFVIVQGDLATAEVYVAGVLANDSFIQRAFIEKLDFHSYVAKQIFNLPCEVHEVKTKFPDKRQHAKAITFGIMYQAGPAKVAEQADVTMQEAKNFIDKYFSEAHALKDYIDDSNNFIRQHAFIYSILGRKRRLPESTSPNRGVAQHAIRSGVNFLVQSVASDINILGLIDQVNWIKEMNYQEVMIPFTVVHDSIVSEVREDYVDEYVLNTRKFIQKDRGCSIPNCPIGMDFEIGPSWGELENYKVAA